MAQVVRCWPSNCKVLSSDPNTKKQKQERERERERERREGKGRGKGREKKEQITPDCVVNFFKEYRSRDYHNHKRVSPKEGLWVKVFQFSEVPAFYCVYWRVGHTDQFLLLTC
jgi:hypothetical protein